MGITMLSAKRVGELEDEIARLQNEIHNLKKSYVHQHEQEKKAREKAEHHEKILQSLVEAAVGKIGQDFFDTIIIRLSEWLGAECVLIGRMTENERVEAVPLYLDGKILHGFSYNLIGSPCEITRRQGFCSFPENVIEHFPKDQILVDLNAQGYIGIALFDKNGETNGVICAVSRKQMNIPPYAQEILKIIGSRVTAEIERIKAEEELSVSEKKLRESNKTKDKFFSIIAHDLRSSINIINGFSELLVSKFDKYPPDKQKKYLENIFLATKSSHNLLENLLTWSLMQRGLIEFKRTKVQLNQVITKTLTLLSHMASAKHISVELKTTTEILVYADVNMLSTVLRNLISNAIKFTPKGGKVEVTYMLDNENNNGYAIIEVLDSGVGIESERIDHLFRIEETCSTPGTNAEIGTGLGLILCKEFVEKQEGSIWVESTPDTGSKFSFTLKIA